MHSDTSILPRQSERRALKRAWNFDETNWSEIRDRSFKQQFVSERLNRTSLNDSFEQLIEQFERHVANRVANCFTK